MYLLFHMSQCCALSVKYDNSERKSSKLSAAKMYDFTNTQMEAADGIYPSSKHISTHMIKFFRRKGLTRKGLR